MQGGGPALIFSKRSIPPTIRPIHTCPSRGYSSAGTHFHPGRGTNGRRRSNHKPCTGGVTPSFRSFPTSGWEREAAKLRFALATERDILVARRRGAAREPEVRTRAFPNRVWER